MFLPHMLGLGFQITEVDSLVLSHTELLPISNTALFPYYMQGVDSVVGTM